MFDTDIEYKGEEVTVHVDYNGGYFRKGNRSGHPDNWTPDEGEWPEITSVRIADTGEEIIKDLDSKTIEKLTQRAWSDQEKGNEEPDPFY